MKHGFIDSMKKAIAFTVEKGFQVIIGFEDASRAKLDFLIKLSKEAYMEGVRRIRYADTVGILTPSKIKRGIIALREAVDMSFGIHAHDDFGMALANSLEAINSGADYVDCTFKGIGERAGNCDYYKFLKAVAIINKKPINLQEVLRVQEEIFEIIGLN